MSEWIRVEDKLPTENDAWCLVFSDGAMNCMMFDKGRFYDATHSPCHNIQVDDITHWMPLPRPPAN